MDSGTLMDELVEGVLSVGPGLAPDDWSGVVVDTGAIFSDVLSVGLHVTLWTTCITIIIITGSSGPKMQKFLLVWAFITL